MFNVMPIFSDDKMFIFTDDPLLEIIVLLILLGVYALVLRLLAGVPFLRICACLITSSLSIYYGYMLNGFPYLICMFLFIGFTSAELFFDTQSVDCYSITEHLFSVEINVWEGEETSFWTLLGSNVVAAIVIAILITLWNNLALILACIGLIFYVGSQIYMFFEFRNY